MFERFVIVDWSASSNPKSGKDSIWVCNLDGDRAAVTANPRTRTAAEALVRDLLVEAAGSGQRTLVGFDFPYGYPGGFGAALRLDDPAWLSVWSYLVEHIRDGPDNENNRFEVASGVNQLLTHHAFWGCPVSRRFDHLSSRRNHVRYRVEGESVGLSEWREVESILSRRGKHPHSAWKLLGAGSVGSQSLTGIPVLSRLRRDRDLSGLSRVWPFEIVVPDSPEGQPAIVHAEIWPSLIEVAYVNDQVKDETQVIRLSLELRDADRAGRLQSCFAAGESSVAGVEGWILGVPSDATVAGLLGGRSP